MSRHKQEIHDKRRQQILDGALKVFAQKGFEKATNREIAEVAGIKSAGLVYHYFKDKQDLLRCVMEERANYGQLMMNAEALLDMPPREALTMIAAGFVALLSDENTSSLARLMVIEALRQPGAAQTVYRQGPGATLQFLQRYMVHQMALGNLRRVNAEIAAQQFLGPLLIYTFVYGFLEQPEPPNGRETLVQNVVDIFLKGMLPD